MNNGYAQGTHLSEEKKDYIREILLDSVATEFFHPLNLITLDKDYLQMHLQQKEQNYDREKVFEALDGIGCAAAQLDRLMNNCLDLLNCLQERTRPQKETVDIWAMVSDIAADCTKGAEILGIKLELQGPAKPLMVETDRFMAERIILNLFSNALRISPAGCTVKVVLRKENDGCCFCISDGGRSVSPAFALQAFQIRPRTSALDRERFLDGDGLGIFLCGEFCRLLGWQPALHPAKKGNSTTVHIPQGQIVSGQRLVFHSNTEERKAYRARIKDLVCRELCCLPGLEALTGK